MIVLVASSNDRQRTTIIDRDRRRHTADIIVQNIAYSKKITLKNKNRFVHLNSLLKSCSRLSHICVWVESLFPLHQHQRRGRRRKGKFIHSTVILNALC